MTTPNEELRKLAEECLDRDPLEEGDVSFPGFSTSWCALQREFIMAANPSTVIALLDELQSQSERIAELERESETHAKAYGLAIVERNKLRTEVEAVRKANLDCVDHYNAALDEINELGQQLKVAQEGWRCECSTDDACRFARERDALRAQLAEIEEAEPVAKLKPCKEGWFIDLDNPPPLTGETIELFTRPMPAQDVTELVEALEEYGRAGVGNSTDWRVQLSALRLATAALSKYKGAK